MITRYGKDRCQLMYKFYDKICRYYGVLYSEKTLEDWVEDLNKFSIDDLRFCLDELKKRETTMPLRFNEVYSLCLSSYTRRKKEQEIADIQKKQAEYEKNSVPMPGFIKEKIKNLSQQTRIA